MLFKLQFEIFFCFVKFKRDFLWAWKDLFYLGGGVFQSEETQLEVSLGRCFCAGTPLLPGRHPYKYRNSMGWRMPGEAEANIFSLNHELEQLF